MSQHPPHQELPEDQTPDHPTGEPVDHGQEDQANQSPGQHGEGNVQFLLGPIDHPDGTPVLPTQEAKRRLEANLELVKALAKQLGLELCDNVESDPLRVEDSQRSQEIKPIANPKMADAARRSRDVRKSLEMTLPDGTQIKASHSETEREAYFNLEKSIKALKDLVAVVVRWPVGISVRCGKWFRAKATATREDD